MYKHSAQGKRVSVEPDQIVVLAGASTIMLHALACIGY
jgi:hypothetical protein